MTSGTPWRLPVLLVAWGCSHASATTPGPPWLSGRREEQAVQLERHLRGFDVAMTETGYRYVELY
jgi:hypothetical protein